jgi:2-phospho-L-lactate guanylyltransferase
MLWALVPVKELTESKQRLAKVLDPTEREGLVLAMLQDVLTAIRCVPMFDGVLLVSRSQRAQSLARHFVTDIFEESPGSDHSRAVTEANRYLVERYQAQSSLAISGDVPRVTAEDIRQIIADHDRVTLVPNDGGEGTNAIVASPPNVVTCQFGGPSLKRHVASADATGLSSSVVYNANIAKDIDEPRDLEQALQDLSPSFTRDFLENSGIAARLKSQQPFQSAVCLQQGLAGQRT